MKFSMELKTLAEALNVVSRAVAIKGVRPILSNLLISAHENEVRFVGTDMEIMMISNIPAEVEEQGNFTIPAKLLSEIISGLPCDGNQKVIFSLDTENESMVHIKTDRTKFDLQIQGIDEYPPVPSLEGEDFPSFEIDTEIFAQGLKEACIAKSGEDGNPVQRSVCINLESPSQAVFVATDSKRLAVTTANAVEAPQEFQQSFIIPARAIPEWQKLLDSQKTMTMGLYNGQLVFSNDKSQLISRLIDGQFPDYNRVLPKESSKQLKLNKKEFAESLKVVLPIARLSSMLVHMDIGQNETRIWAESKELGLSEAFLSSELTGDPINIAFNIKYISDFLNTIKDEEILLEMTTPNYPGVLRPLNSESGFKYVVMPMSY